MLINPAEWRRAVAFAVYASVAVHLPWSPRPFGRLSRRFRRVLAQRMLDRCGTNVNVEHGARFGSGKGIELGDNSDIGMDALIIGPVTIGDDVMMGPRCMLIASTHAHGDITIPMNQQGFAADRRIVIEDDVWLGAGATVLPGRRVGRGSIVAAGSVVTRNVPSMSIVGGNPANVIGSRERPRSSVSQTYIAENEASTTNLR